MSTLTLLRADFSDSYSVIGQVWMLFIVNIQQWSLDTMCGFNTPDHLKSQYFTSYGTKAFIGGSLQKILTTQ